MALHNLLVSVVIPAYNAADTLGATLRSIRGQSHRNLEILVVDDGSTDTTADLVRAVAASDERVVLVGDGANHGRSHARNAGIDAAMGTWVGFVDSDDLWDPRRVTRLLTAAAAFPRSRVLTSDHLGFRVDDDGRVEVLHWFPSVTSIRAGRDHPLDLRWWFGDRACMMQPFVRRDHLESTGVRYPEGYSVGEDNLFNIAVVFSTDSQPVRVAECLSYYRDHATGRSVGSAENLARGVNEIVERTGNDQLADLAGRHLGSLCWIRRRGEGLMDPDRVTEADTALAEIDVPLDRWGGTISLARSKALQEYAALRYRRVLREKAETIESLLSPP